MILICSGKSEKLFITPDILDSLLEGSTNAFLTLRVDNMTRRYCGHLGVIDKRKIKTESVKEATGQLSKIVMSGSGKIISGIASAAKNAGIDTLKSGWIGVKNAGIKVKDNIIDTTSRVNPFKKELTKE